jgi:hypothetical protein
VRVAEEERKRNLRRLYAGLAVAAVHVLFVVVLIAAQWVPIPVKPNKIAPLQWIVLQAPMRADLQNKIKPRAPNVGTVDPNLIIRLPRPKIDEENNAINDWGWALGRSLACGASSYEWLNNKMRAECKHKPWDWVYDRYGNVVLDARPRLPQAEETIRPSDVQARERNTAPACPGNADPNAPCLSDVIHGRRF